MARKTFYVQWHLLDRCNLRCRHCYQDHFSSRSELRWPELQILMENLVEATKKWNQSLEIALTGGEPFLKKELRLILETLEALPQVRSLSIITNGLILPPWLEELKNLKKFRELRISLDGVSPETNDEIRGKGTYERVLAGMRKVREAGLPFIIMFTVMNRNRHEVPWLFELARKTGARGFILERFFPLGQGKNFLEEVVQARDFLLIWQQILDLSQLSARPKDLIPFRAIKVDLREPRPQVFGAGCVVGRDGLALMPDGTIFPCRRFPLPLGNLLKQSLTEIWSGSKLLTDLRNKDKLKGHCHRCSIRACFGCRAMSYVLTGDPLAEDPHCWLIDSDQKKNCLD